MPQTYLAKDIEFKGTPVENAIDAHIVYCASINATWASNIPPEEGEGVLVSI